MSPETSRPTPARLRAFLAAALRGDAASASWPGDGWAAALPKAAIYHGVAGLLADMMERLQGWPADVLADIQAQARAEAMWELRHRDLLCRLLAELADDRVRVLVLKGSALAYELYPRPAARPRGDSDLLVEAKDVPAARRVLARLGYQAYAAGRGLEWLQQSWTLACDDGTRHAIDLHWAVLNAAALAAVLPVADCFRHARPLPGLCAEAWTMDRVRTVLHLCVHMSLHRTAPYLVGDEANFGGDRLIWSFDVHLLAERLDEKDWSLLADLAVEQRAAGPCFDGLQAAQADFGSEIPETVTETLSGAAPRDLPYLTGSRPAFRAWQDFKAMPGILGKLSYVLFRLLPDSRFLRSKYPDMADSPLPLLHLRRVIEAARRRSS